MFHAFTEEQQMIRDTARRFVAEEVAPRVKEMDRTGEFPADLMRRCAELGFTSILIPREYGGLGLGVKEFCLVLEEISRESQTLAIILDAAVTLCYMPILWSGTEAQKQKYLPMCAAGRLGAVAFTEPSGTRNFPAWNTKAVREGDEWVLNGMKMFVTNSQAADIYIVQCRVDDNVNPSMILVEKGTPGFTFGNIEKKLGWNGSNTGTIYFDNARVPAANLIGALHEGYLCFMQSFYESCVGIGAMCVGSAAGALKRTLEYAKQRNVLGQNIVEHQSVAESIARAAMEVESSRMMVYQTADLMDAGQVPNPGAPVTFLASACKVQPPEMASRVCDLAIQLHGGFGYMTDTDIHRYWRDVRACQIGEGPTYQHLGFMAELVKMHDII